MTRLSGSKHAPGLTDTSEPTTSQRIDFGFARPGSCPAASLASTVLGDQPVQLADGRWPWPSDHFGVVSALRCPRPAR